MRSEVTRRQMLKGFAALGVAAGGAVAVEPARRAAAQAGRADAGRADAAVLGVHERVDDALKRLFGTRPLKDGAGVVKLDLPLIAENGSVVPVAVDVASPMTPANYVRHIYIVADKNRIPVITRVALTPEAGQASIGANVRLGETGDVRAIVEQSDGSLLQVKREVKVTVSGCGG
jgi:sulfur-oxidizing protein SoxY